MLFVQTAFDEDGFAPFAEVSFASVSVQARSTMLLVAGGKQFTVEPDFPWVRESQLVSIRGRSSRPLGREGH